MRSTHFRRTINSAKSILAGIYSKTPESTDYTFLINVNDLAEDYMFPNNLDCPYFAEMLKIFPMRNLHNKKNEYIQR